MRGKLCALACVTASIMAILLLVSSARHPQRVSAEAGATAETVLNETVAEQADFRNDIFEVEVLVGGRPLEQYLARGRRYVEALKGAEYELRIRNPLGERVAVALSVDGMNSIDARRTSAWNASKWVIGPYQTITIRGWQMSGERARRFYFTSERDSYGAKLGQTANLGIISAVFFRERQPVAVVPPPPRPMEDRSGRDEERSQSNTDAPKSSAETGAAASSRAKRGDVYPQPDKEEAATGIGRNVRNDVRWVNMDLDSRPSGEINIRYEYRDALIRLGIMPRSYPYPDPLDRRERSNGFEDRRYSPEP
jgi:hypothetical protein